MRARHASTLVLILLMVLGARAFGQSPADKATARQLASEGIELYQAGKFPEALDKLERAEKLFGAPVHLLYIARTQAKLDRLVEAAENYRRLVRVKLEPDAPDAFAQAIEDGKKELAEIEPAIPALRIDVTPAQARGLGLTIDGQPVSSAVVGVDRPINPGQHTVRASAKGYAAREERVTLARGEKKSIALALRPGSKDAEKQAQDGDRASAIALPEKPLGVFLGLRLFGAIPANTTVSYRILADREGELMKSGGGVELHGGLRFAHYFAGKLYVDFFSMRTSDAFVDDTPVSGFETGLGLHAGTKPRQLGGFGEIGIGFVQSFTASVQDANPSCSHELTWRANPTFRIGGGAVVPLGRYFQLTPFMLANFAEFKHHKSDFVCDGKSTFNPTNIDQEIPEDSRLGGHQLFLLGLGADWLIGG